MFLLSFYLVDSDFIETINYDQSFKNILLVVPVYLDESEALHQVRFNIEKC